MFATELPFSWRPAGGVSLTEDPATRAALSKPSWGSQGRRLPQLPDSSVGQVSRLSHYVNDEDINSSDET